MNYYLVTYYKNKMWQMLQINAYWVVAHYFINWHRNCFNMQLLNSITTVTTQIKTKCMTNLNSIIFIFMSIQHWHSLCRLF